MYDTPRTLLDLCLDTICARHADIFATCTPTLSGPPYDAVDDQHDDDDDEEAEEETARPARLTLRLPPEEHRQVYTFPDADFFLCNELAERLFARFVAKGLLDDATLYLFRARHTRLRCVRLRQAAGVTAHGLRVLREHKLRELQCVGLQNVSVGLLLECISAHTTRHLTSLDVSRCSFIDGYRHSALVHLTRLKRLKCLSVAFTEFNQRVLEMICEDLHDLERIDVSGTWVQSLRPLLALKNRLVGLVASDLSGINTMTKDIIELVALRHLDISLIQERFEGVQNAAISDILESVDKLPQLTSLDISGWRDFIPKATLLAFIKEHPQLRFLGLVLNPIVFELFLSEPPADLELRIAGLGNEAQIQLALRMHYERPNYVQKALYHLFLLTDAFTASREDVFQLVLNAMAAHAKRFSVQMAATACLYNLTRGEMAKQIHPKHLARAVHLTLNAMETFPIEYQLHKNALLTLCSDRILQDVTFNRYRCATIVLDSLCTFDEIHMNRMSVAICSILAAKISTAETSQLGGHDAYMKKLLAMVQQRVESRTADITMKFTLSALWNLTDESAETCRVFLANNGAQLFLEVLRVFRKEAAVETKVLGLLNNIAEVGALRGELMIDALLAELHALLTYDMIDVNYFAAGIVAHLASDGVDAWTATAWPRDTMLDVLEAVVTGWGIPDNEMVAYRSFKPFFPLLRVGIDYRVQLWAVWAVHHVCTKNADRYCGMLKEEDGVELLAALIEDAATHSIAREKCAEVLRHVHANRSAGNTATAEALPYDDDGGGGEKRDATYVVSRHPQQHHFRPPASEG